MRALVLLTLLLTGCPKPSPTPPPIPDTNVPLCSTAASVTFENVCDGAFTSDGYSCVRCPMTSGCVDSTLLIYCMTGSCKPLTDPLCQTVPTTRAPDAGASAKHR